MSRSEIDGIIVLPEAFGDGPARYAYPSARRIVYYTQNNDQAGQRWYRCCRAHSRASTAKLCRYKGPFTVAKGRPIKHSLSAFDYTFTGLLGFAILGAGIFGPMNVFPELKKMGILRRLHTTPLRVWQYFLANMLSNAVTGSAVHWQPCSSVPSRYFT